MFREAPLKYVVTFHVEVDTKEALEAAVEYVAKHIAGGWVGYVCGPYACVCKAKLEWDGSRLTVRSCVKRTAHVVAKLLIKAYVQRGGKSIRLIKCEEYRP